MIETLVIALLVLAVIYVGLLITGAIKIIRLWNRFGSADPPDV